MSGYHEDQITDAEKISRDSTSTKADYAQALRGLLDAAKHYKKKADEAEPIMSTIEGMVHRIVDDRERDY